MPRIRKLVAVSVRTKEKLSNSPGWLTASVRYILHGVRFIWDSIFSSHKEASHTLSFYPYTPLPIYTIWGVCKELGISVNKSQEGKVMFFADKTTYTKDIPHTATRWINGRCRDISKSTISSVYEEVFGTSLLIDPTTFTGRAVEKSEENGTHDGRIVSCPLKRTRRGKVYQRVVNNEIRPGVVEDLRAVIVADEIPYVYRKRRAIEDRFLNTNPEVLITHAQEVFSQDELAKVLQYAKRVGIDFGELDILRDKDSGTLFIVDANTTSMSPPIMLPYETRRRCIRNIAEAFERSFLNTQTRPTPARTTDSISRASSTSRMRPALAHTK